LEEEIAAARKGEGKRKAEMTEQGYIDATNLAKIRVAKNVIRDMLFFDPDVEKIQKQLIKGLSLLEEGVKQGKLRGRLSVEDIKESFVLLTNDERIDIILTCCKECGRVSPTGTCQCWNDE
jgi:hypothetical protein